jgi:hypothetical protein
MFIRTIYERIQMNRILNFKGNRAERHACASSNICRMPYAITVWTPAGAQKIDLSNNDHSKKAVQTSGAWIKWVAKERKEKTKWQREK